MTNYTKKLSDTSKNLIKAYASHKIFWDAYNIKIHTKVFLLNFHFNKNSDASNGGEQYLKITVEISVANV